MLDQTTRVESMTNWPPYNIEKAGEDQYRITMAVAGFSPDEIELTRPERTQVLHRGVATRAFEPLPSTPPPYR